MGGLDPKLLEPLDDIEWTPDLEVLLLNAMVGHKPIGLVKHFQMACIWSKFTSSINKNVTSAAIWKRLESMYELSTLDDAEFVPFPNNEQEFFLPVEEYGSLMQERLMKASSAEDVLPTEEDKESKSRETTQSKQGIKNEDKEIHQTKKERKLSNASRKEDKKEISNKKVDKDDNNKKEEKKKLEDKKEEKGKKEERKDSVSKKVDEKNVRKDDDDDKETKREIKSKKEDDKKERKKDDKKDVQGKKDDKKDTQIKKEEKKDFVQVKKEDKKDIKKDEKKDLKSFDKDSRKSDGKKQHKVKDEKKRDSNNKRESFEKKESVVEKKSEQKGSDKKAESIKKRDSEKRTETEKKEPSDKKSESGKQEKLADIKLSTKVRLSRDRSDSETSGGSSKKERPRDSSYKQSEGSLLEEVTLSSRRGSITKRSTRSAPDIVSPIKRRRI